MTDTSRDPAEDYYDPMARDYHLLFSDWRETVFQESETLDRLIRQHTGRAVLSVLDSACGIGTQSIALALRGYPVHATDLSEGMIARARTEASAFGVSVTFGVADIRALESQIEDRFDVVLACDNALPHMLTDEDLLLACRSLASRLHRGGLLLASIRDYDRARELKPRFLHQRVYDDASGRRIIFQVWDWRRDGVSYTVHQFILRELKDRQAGGDWETLHYDGEYRALLREELAGALTQAGFVDIRWEMPGESGYYQPIVTARRA